MWSFEIMLFICLFVNCIVLCNEIEQDWIVANELMLPFAYVGVAVSQF